MTKDSVFIGWGNKRGKDIANILYEFLVNFFNDEIDFYLSLNEKKINWASNILEETKKAKLGIFCILKENITSLWMHYEAGALGKNIYPILFDVKESNLVGPFNLLNPTIFGEEEFKKIIIEINKLCSSPLKERALDYNYPAQWKSLDLKVKNILSKTDDISEIDKDVMIQEILFNTRDLVSAKESNFINEKKVRHIIDFANINYDYFINKSNKIDANEFIRFKETIEYFISMVQVSKQEDLIEYFNGLNKKINAL